MNVQLFVRRDGWQVNERSVTHGRALFSVTRDSRGRGGCLGQAHGVVRAQQKPRSSLRCLGADLRMSSTRKIISAASDADSRTWRLTWNDSVMPMASMSPTVPFTMSAKRSKKVHVGIDQTWFSNLYTNISTTLQT